MAQLRGFVAYPSSPPECAGAIRAAVERTKSDTHAPHFETWEHADIAGRPLHLPLLAGIEEAQILVADVTRLNFNVTYEIGYAIGRAKRVLLVRNKTLTTDDVLARKVGIFDTLGYENYATSDDLARLLQTPIDPTPLKMDTTLDRKTPLYLIETPQRTDAMTRIVARVKRARLFYRSFAPSEDTRLGAIDAIRHTSSSIGVLVPLLSPQFADAIVHNIRAAFVAGLAHGMAKKTLLLQDGRHDVALDVRDAAETYVELDDIDQHVERLAGDIYETLQGTDPVSSAPGTLLQQLSLGDPMAENEFQRLGGYYVQTDEYSRALRGEVNLVVGRKGTGKTALFFQVRDRVRRDRRNVVVDLKPEGYQLLKLKEQVLDLLSEGAKAHLITAFWEYLLLIEIARKVLENDRSKSRVDSPIADAYGALDALVRAHPASEGDFSERLLVLSQNIISAFKSAYGTAANMRLTADEVTNLLHATEIPDLRIALTKYLDHKDQVLVLFDNLDKGWTYKGIGAGDILILRCLIDAARKVQRDVRKADVPMSCIVFVRNDIYELLMNASPDYGKETRAALDWRDPDLLREVLRRRLVLHLDEKVAFQPIWGRFCVSHYEGQETSQFLIERSLMRPRHLLKLVGYCRSVAVNLDHTRIEADDITKGLGIYSSDVVIEADRELADLEPAAEGLIYSFVREASEMSEADLRVLISLHGVAEDRIDRVIDVLLYLGFLGVKLDREDARYIHDTGYDLSILRALQEKSGQRCKCVLNPAFWAALDVQPA